MLPGRPSDAAVEMHRASWITCRPLRTLLAGLNTGESSSRNVRTRQMQTCMHAKGCFMDFICRSPLGFAATQRSSALHPRLSARTVAWMTNAFEEAEHCSNCNECFCRENLVCKNAAGPSRDCKHITFAKRQVYRSLIVRCTPSAILDMSIQN